jgi:DNA polymerase-3 subunit delta'
MSKPVWESLVGQEHAIGVLRSAALAAAAIVARAEEPRERGADGPVQVAHSLSAAMTHAWLFTGPPGSGRSVAARALAAALQCDRNVGPPAEPELAGCGVCPACHTVLAGTHPDVRAVIPEGLSISVKEIRMWITTAARRPSLGRWQVIIIEDADRLTEGASNALLKAIEEPPERTVFLLCAPSTHPDDVSVTIRSRCRLVALRTPSVDAVAAHLRESGASADDAAWVAAAAQGHIGRARRLLRDSDARDRRDSVLSIPSSLRSMAACFAAADQLVGAAKRDAAVLSAELDSGEVDALRQALGAGGTGKGTAAATRGMAGQVKDLEKRQKSRATRVERDALDRALVDLAWFYRDALLYRTGSSVALVHPDRRDDVIATALAMSPAQILKCIDAILACQLAVEQNVKPQIAVEAMAAALRLPA